MIPHPSSWRVRTKLTATFALSFLAFGLLFILANFAVVEPLQGETLSRDAILSAVSGIVVVTLVSVPAGWWVAGRVLEPVQSITSRSRTISAENLHDRIGLDGPQDELKELADTIDELLDRLEASFDRERRFVANASHELRTPLAVTRAALELGLGEETQERADGRAALDQALAATARSERLVNELLLLARLESAGSDETELVDLADVAREVCHDRARAAEEAGVTIVTDLEPAQVTGVTGLLDRLVVNLIDNSITHNVRGGDVLVRTDGCDVSCTLTVENSCRPRGIGDAAGAELFEPFRRGAPAADGPPDGHGLGLSIVRAIVLAHHGTATANLLDAGPPRFRIYVSFPTHRT